MPEWWTYRLADFLLFSPRTYYRMIERFNEALWPVHVVTLMLGCTIPVLLLRPRLGRFRVIWLSLGLLWGWVAWAFLWHRYSSINWAAVYFIPLFALQALLLLRTASGPVRPAATRRGKRALGVILLTGSLVLYPAMAPLAGRPWRQAEVFGMTPDPTAIATLGVTLLVSQRISGLLLVVPVLWCLISGLTLWAMGSPEAWLLPLAALLGTGSFWLPRQDGELPIRSMPGAGPRSWD
jgi:hypothetical protein